MADVKISGLPASTVPLAGTEVLPIVQGGTTKQVSVNNLTAGKAIEGLSLTLTSTDAGASQAPTIDLYRDSASPAASDTIGEIEFNGEDSVGNKQAYALLHGSILSPTSGAEQGQIHFETATAGALTEKMIIGTTNLVINEPGNIFNVRIEGDTDANLFYTDATNSRVGVGTISPATKLDVNGSFNVAGAATLSPANAAVAISPTGTGTVTINPATASTMNNVAIGGTTPLTGVFTTVKASTTVGVGAATPAASGAGITFPATQSNSSDVNTLDDYEEGTWTATLQAATTNPTTPVTTTGTYTKIGRQVTISFNFNNVDTTGASGNTFVSGLPFAAASGMPSFIGQVAMAGLGATLPATYILASASAVAYATSTGLSTFNITAATGVFLQTTITYTTT